MHFIYEKNQVNGFKKKKIKLNNGKCFDCSAIQIRSIKS